jgi:hypothetical protein
MSGSRSSSPKSARKRPQASANSKTKSAHRKKNDPKWSEKVKTVSTYPPTDLYTRDAQTIARVMASKKVSPKGLGSAIRMIQFYINRAGENLSSSRVRELERAKRILQERNKARK